MAKKRITPQALADIRTHMSEVKAERVEYELDEHGDYIIEYGHPKIKPARLKFNVPDRLAAALRFPPADIRELRYNMCSTQSEQAKKLGVSVRTYSAWEAGDVLPSSHHLNGLRKLRDSAEVLPALTPEMIHGMREAYGYTPATFAKEYGVSVSTVLRWEAGKVRPRPEQARKLAEDLQDSIKIGLV